MIAIPTGLITEQVSCTLYPYLPQFLSETCGTSFRCFSDVWQVCGTIYTRVPCCACSWWKFIQTWCEIAEQSQEQEVKNGVHAAELQKQTRTVLHIHVKKGVFTGLHGELSKLSLEKTSISLKYTKWFLTNSSTILHSKISDSFTLCYLRGKCCTLDWLLWGLQSPSLVQSISSYSLK